LYVEAFRAKARQKSNVLKKAKRNDFRRDSEPSKYQNSLAV